MQEFTAQCTAVTTVDALALGTPLRLLDSPWAYTSLSETPPSRTRPRADTPEELYLGTAHTVCNVGALLRVTYMNPCPADATFPDENRLILDDIDPLGEVDNPDLVGTVPTPHRGDL